MKVAFHTNQMCLRGTEIAIYDYAKYNRELLNNESIIFCNANNELVDSVVEKFKSLTESIVLRFPMLDFSNEVEYFK